MEVGAHSVILEAPGREPTTESITLAEGDRKEIRFALGLGAGPVKQPADGDNDPPKKNAVPGQKTPSGSGLRTAGFVAGGVGLAGFLAAGITGGLLLTKHSRIQDRYPDQTCDAEGWQEVNAADALFTVNTIAFITGIAGVGTGAALVLASPSGGDAGPKASASIAPALLRGGGGVAITGSF